MYDAIFVAAQNVQPGDQIWDRHMYTTDKWVTINHVERLDHNVMLWTGSAPWQGSGFGFHAREGVAVRRSAEKA